MADKDKEKKDNPNLGCLEEDDEFEEFPVEGMLNIEIVSRVIKAKRRWNKNWPISANTCQHWVEMKNESHC